MKEYGTIMVEVPDDVPGAALINPLGEAQEQATLMGGTLTGEVEVSRSEAFGLDSGTTYMFKMEREVVGS